MLPLPRASRRPRPARRCSPLWAAAALLAAGVAAGLAAMWATLKSRASRAAWPAQHAGGAPDPPLLCPGRRPLRVGVQNMWLDAATVLGELDVLRRVVFAGTGCELQAVDGSLPHDAQLDSADIILFGPYGDRATSGRVARERRNASLTIFIGSENQWAGGYHDQMVGDVHLSLGHRRDLEHAGPDALGGSAYQRLPWWLPYSIDYDAPPGVCSFSPLLMRHAAVPARVAAAEWASRRGDAALLSSHYAFPRPQLFHLLTAGAGLRVDAPGKAFHNIEWPAGLPNHHLHGKVDFLTGYRFNVCPENSLSGGGGGYATEKLAHALMAGAVPVYWGDPLDDQVWERRRVIVYDGGNNATVLEAVHALLNDSAFREAWFSVPPLAPSAGEWLGGWCASAAGLVRRQLSVLRARAQLPGE